MSTTEQKNKQLAQGDNLNREEFLRIWEELTNLKSAELINGVVYLPSPHDLDHGVMTSKLLAWVTTYSIETTGSLSLGACTWFMLESAPLPDVCLLLLPENGGQSRLDGEFPVGAPELAVEVATSSAAHDLHQKLDLYLDAGVREYLVVVLGKPEIRWHGRTEDHFQLVEPDAGGVFRSLVFPGLWLNGPALLRDDMKAVIATLQEGLRSPEYAEFVAKLQAKLVK